MLGGPQTDALCEYLPKCVSMELIGQVSKSSGRTPATPQRIWGGAG
jgi:hypothetical protein